MKAVLRRISRTILSRSALLRAVAKKLKLDKKIDFGIDAAATDIKGYSRQQLNNTYKKLIKEYSPLYIEDPFGENDFKNFAAITAANNIRGTSKLWIAGDDLTTTNTDRMEARAGEKKHQCHHHQTEPDRDRHGNIERRAPGARIPLGGRRVAPQRRDERRFHCRLCLRRRRGRLQARRSRAWRAGGKIQPVAGDRERKINILPLTLSSPARGNG